MTDPEVFDQNFETWRQEQKEPWMGLRYRLEQVYLQKYLPDKKLEILDAGGGNGMLALALAQDGHRVTLVDYSAEMLADAGQKLAAAGLQHAVRLHQADLLEIPELFPPHSFDVALCHNVIQYLADPKEALTAVQSPLRDQGVLSVVTINKYAEVYKAAFREEDLDRAMNQTQASGTVATLFDHPIRYFTDHELEKMMANLGYLSVSIFGVRCICDWLPNEPKYRPDFMARLQELEIRLSQKYPYFLLARFFQVVGRTRNDDLGK